MKLLKRRHDAESISMENGKKKHRTEIEILPCELWFEIFSYFDGESLLQSFSQLNSSIQSILHDHRLRIHYDLHLLNLSQFCFFHPNQISSLSIDYSQIQFNVHLQFDSFPLLRSLHLMKIKEKQLQQFSAMSVKRLHRLSIHSKCAKYLLKIVSIYFPSIRQIELNSDENEFLLKCFQLEKQISEVEHLILDGTIRLSKLFRLWPWVPHLRSLSMINGGVHQCDYWIDQQYFNENLLPSNLFKIHLKIFDDDLSFVNLERFIGKNLRLIKISGSIADDDLEDYLSSTNWIRFLSQCSDQFESIEFDFSSYYDPSDPRRLRQFLKKYRENEFFRHVQIKSDNYLITMSNDQVEVMDDATREEVSLSPIKKKSKRKNRSDPNSSTSKRLALTDMVFYDGNRHPASVLHELHPEITSKSYQFQSEPLSKHSTRFSCSLTIEKDLSESITVLGHGKSKQSAKNMAAQQALMQLYSTYRPPADAILTEDSDIHQVHRFIPTLPPSIENDPSTLIDSIRKHLTTKALAVKTPLQLFHELFIHNQRLNSSTSTKNRIETIDNEENLFVVRVTAMEQQFWGVSAAKSVAVNEACQQAIETICRISFREAKEQFLHALQSLNKLKTPDGNTSNDDQNNNHSMDEEKLVEEQTTTTTTTTTTELTSLPGLSSSFLIPTDES